MSLNTLINKQIKQTLNKTTNNVINSISEQLNVTRDSLIEIWNQLNPEFRLLSSNNCVIDKPLKINTNRIEDIVPQVNHYEIEIGEEDIVPQVNHYEIEIGEEDIVPQVNHYEIEIGEEDIVPQVEEYEIVDEDF
jgi:hypothetical protein